MRNFPISLLHTFGPTPETPLPDCGGFVAPKILVQVKRLTSKLINHDSHFVLVTRSGFLALDFCHEICRGNLGLTHGHVAQLWTRKVHAVANGVQSFVADHAHGAVDVYVPVVVCDPHVRGCRRAAKWRHQHEQIETNCFSTNCFRPVCRQYTDVEVWQELDLPGFKCAP